MLLTNRAAQAAANSASATRMSMRTLAGGACSITPGMPLTNSCSSGGGNSNRPWIAAAPAAANAASATPIAYINARTGLRRLQHRHKPAADEPLLLRRQQTALLPRPLHMSTCTLIGGAYGHAASRLLTDSCCSGGSQQRVGYAHCAHANAYARWRRARYLRSLAAACRRFIAAAQAAANARCMSTRTLAGDASPTHAACPGLCQRSWRHQRACYRRRVRHRHGHGAL